MNLGDFMPAPSLRWPSHLRLAIDVVYPDGTAWRSPLLAFVPFARQAPEAFAQVAGRAVLEGVQKVLASVEDGHYVALERLPHALTAEEMQTLVTDLAAQRAAVVGLQLYAERLRVALERAEEATTRSRNAMAEALATPVPDGAWA